MGKKKDITTLQNTTTQQEVYSLPNLSEKEKQVISQFLNNIDLKDIKPTTVPSILAVGGPKEIGINKLTPENIEVYLWQHPLVVRGIEIKANRITSRGYTIKPKYENNPAAEEAARAMRELMENSGGIITINSWIQDAYAFGNGYLTLVPNKNETKIIKLQKEHPIFFRIAREPVEDKQKDNYMFNYTQSISKFANRFNGPLKIDPITRKPLAYTQVKFDVDNKTMIPFGKEIPADYVAHLKFDVWGDEVEGVSVVQYMHNIIKYLINIEEAAAYNIWRNGFTQKKVISNVKTERDLRRMAKNLSQLSHKDIILLPEGTNVENLIPGQTQFPDIHEIFLKLISIRLGIPLPILTLDGRETNKATIDVLEKDMYNDLRADELKIKQTIEEQIFLPACKLLFGEDFNEIPIFDFNFVEESKTALADRNRIISETIYRIANSIQILTDIGVEKQVVDKVVNFLNEVIPDDIREEPMSSSKKDEIQKTNREPEKGTGENPEQSQAGETKK